MIYLVNEDDRLPTRSNIKHLLKGGVEGRGSRSDIAASDNVQRPSDVLRSCLSRERLSNTRRAEQIDN